MDELHLNPDYNENHHLQYGPDLMSSYDNSSSFCAFPQSVTLHLVDIDMEDIPKDELIGFSKNEYTDLTTARQAGAVSLLSDTSISPIFGLSPVRPEAESLDYMIVSSSDSGSNSSYLEEIEDFKPFHNPITNNSLHHHIKTEIKEEFVLNYDSHNFTSAFSPTSFTNEHAADLENVQMEAFSNFSLREMNDDDDSFTKKWCRLITEGKNNRPRGPKCWEFLLRILVDKKGNPCLVKWTDESKGCFCLVDKDRISSIWGKRKGKKSIKYESFARILRYHYKKNKGFVQPFKEKHLVYRFSDKLMADYRAKKLHFLYN